MPKLRPNVKNNIDGTKHQRSPAKLDVFMHSCILPLAEVYSIILAKVSWHINCPFLITQLKPL